MTLIQEVMDDPLAISLASALAIANRQALSQGRNALESRISVTQTISEEGKTLWRINYGTASPVGKRGGVPRPSMFQSAPVWGDRPPGRPLG